MKSVKPTVKNETSPDPDEGALLAENGMGEVKIHENVISALVRKAAMSVDGVARLAGSQIVDIIAETVGSRRMQDRAISVSLTEDDRIMIELKINLKFGYNIPDVTLAVQKSVIAEVENTTGKSVTRVNVLVQELEAEEPSQDSGDTGSGILIPPQH